MPVPELGAGTLHGAQPVQLVSAIVMCRALEDLQRQGAGTATLAAALDAAKQGGEKLVLVFGNPSYYTRFGFVRADELGLLPPAEALYDWAFQVAILESEAEVPQGRVVYSEPFRH